MTEPAHTAIAVHPTAFFESHRRLWEALEALAAVRFYAWDDGDPSPPLAAWLQDPPATLVASVTERGGRCLVWPRAGGVAGSGQEECAVVFGRQTVVDEAWRGQTLERHGAFDRAEIPVSPGAAVLASAGGRPLWVRETVSGGGVVDRLAALPPSLADGRLLRQDLKPWNCARVVPVIQILRETAGDGGWSDPARRACFIFDDPNLHWPSYGCVRFPELARHAERHGYHAAIATVPHDAWRVDGRVASLLRRHTAQLSLLIHGNDHIHHEMWRTRSQTEWTELLAQALRRLGGMEREWQVSVSRVMEAPHALISRDAVGPMGRLGYEAALFTPALAGVYSRQAGWPVALGCRPMDAAIDGVAMLPRIPLSSHWRTDLSMACFLRQPMIVAGHHQDAAEGLEFLAELAAWVKRADRVAWSGLRGLVRSRYQARQEGAIWHLKMGAREVECAVPSGVTEIRVERPWKGGGGEVLQVAEWGGSRMPVVTDAGVIVLPRPVGDPDPLTLSLESRPTDALDPETVPSPRPRVWPLARRVLAEARDRGFPFVPPSLRRRKPAFRIPLIGET